MAVRTEVIGLFDGEEEVTAQQRKGIVNYIQRKHILSVLPAGYGKSLPGICRALNTMGYTSYPKKVIILVICPLNALIESHMKELWQRSISCTCLSQNDAYQDGDYNGYYSLVFAKPEALLL